MMELFFGASLVEKVPMTWSSRAGVSSATFTVEEPAPNYSAHQSGHIFFGKGWNEERRRKSVKHVSWCWRDRMKERNLDLQKEKITGGDGKQRASLYAQLSYLTIHVRC